MAQEVDIFKSARPAAAFASLGGEQHESLADGIGQGYAVIGYKGKNWTIRHDGESYPFVRTIKDDQGVEEVVPMNSIDVILLRSASSKSKSFYPPKAEGGGYDPEASEGRRPDCASLDGITPDNDVPHKQADLCGICPRNVWKTMPNGKKGQDCTDYKRLAVCVLPSLAARVLGHPFQEPAFLRVPPASLAGLAKFGELAKAQGYHYSTFVTRISFDPDEPHPKFLYKAVALLTDKEAPFVLELRESAIARRITGEDSHTEAVARLSAPQGPLALAAPAVKQAATQDREPSAHGEPIPSATTASPSKPVAQRVTPPSVVTHPEPEVIDTGFGVTLERGTVSVLVDGGSDDPDLTVAAKPPRQKRRTKAEMDAATAPLPAGATTSTVPTTQTAADTGDVTESDEELDKQVAAMLAQK
jgi:hypothetical protein